MGNYSHSNQMRDMLNALNKLSETTKGSDRTSTLMEYKREITAKSLGNKLLGAISNAPTHSLPDGLQGAQTLIRMVQKPNDYSRLGGGISMNIGSKSVSMSPETAPQVLAQNQQVIIDLLLSYIEQGDPTPSKVYTPWLAREVASGNIKNLEDIQSRLTPLLGDYEKYKRKKDFPQEGRDIMRLTAPAFEKIVGEYTPPEEEQKNRGDVETVFDDESVRVLVPKDETAACYYGQGTTWCTAATRGNNMFNHYNQQGKMYILLPKTPKYDGEKYQLHFQSGQFMDEQDDPVELINLITERFPELKDFFLKVEPELQDYISFASDDLLGRLISKVGEFIQEKVWDIITDWESNDDYYYNWKVEQAEEKGYVDDNGEVDWDKTHDDDELNDYTQYNDEARMFSKDAEGLIKMTPDDLRDYAEQYKNDEDEEPTMKHLDDVYRVAIKDKFGREDGGLDSFIRDRLHITKDKDTGEWDVRLLKEDTRGFRRQ
jgi:hypothetical protein